MSTNRILIADDEPDYAEIIASIAEEIGFNVTLVHDGSEVVQRVSAVDPDVIVLDLRMPGSDGVEILNSLSTNGCTSQIILISGLGKRTLNSVETVGREKKLNVAGVLGKPMLPEEIQGLLIPLYSLSPNSSTSAESVSDAETDSSYGLSVNFIPHVNVREPEEPRRRISIEGCWKLDSGELLYNDEMFAWSKEQGIGKGIVELLLQSTLNAASQLGSIQQKLEIELALNPVLLQDDGIVDLVSSNLQHRGFPPERLIIKTTESYIYQNQNKIVETLSRLQILGFRIAVETTSSSSELLSMVDRLPMDEIILDMNPITRKANFSTDMETEFAISSINSVARKKELETCAINVGTPEHLEFVHRCRFDRARGNLIGKSRPIQSLAEIFNQICSMPNSPAVPVEPPG